MSSNNNNNNNNNNENNDQKTVTQQVKDSANSAYESIPSFQDVKEYVSNLFASNKDKDKEGDDKDKDKDKDNDELFKGVNMQDFTDWFNKNIKGHEEEDDQTKYEKIKNWFSEQKEQAGDDLSSFKKDIDDLFDKYSSSNQHAEEVEKAKKELQLIDWDALKDWYNKNIKGEEDEKTRYEKVKEWVGLNSKSDKKE